MQVRWKRYTIILLAIALVLGGITAYLYSKNGLVSVKNETEEEQKSYENHSITRIVNKTIVTDVESVRKDIVFQFRKGALKEDISYVKQALTEHFNNENVSIVASKQDGINTIRLTIYHEDENNLNLSLQKILGENNSIQYKYKEQSQYKGSSKLTETTDISSVVEYFNYSGDIGYEVYGYKDEILGKVKINNKTFDVDASYLKGEGSEQQTVEFAGAYENYWPIAKKIEQIIFGVLVVLILIILLRKEKALLLHRRYEKE